MLTDDNTRLKIDGNDDKSILNTTREPRSERSDAIANQLKN